MGILNKIFGERLEETVSKLKWIPLTDSSQLEEISVSEKTVGIFKHSTRCYTSKIVKKQFEQDFELDADQITIYYLDLITYREISNEISNKYSIRHESPQLLIIKKNTLMADGSHMGVLKLDLAKFI